MKYKSQAHCQSPGDIDNGSSARVWQVINIVITSSSYSFCAAHRLHLEYLE
jgi:hypothetical protein